MQIGLLHTSERLVKQTWTCVCPGQLEFWKEGREGGREGQGVRTAGAGLMIRVFVDAILTITCRR